MTEKERRRVNVNFRPHGRVFEIKLLEDGSFGLYDEADVLAATSLSDHALSNWAFNDVGAFMVKSNYDLAKGDMSR